MNIDPLSNSDIIRQALNNGQKNGAAETGQFGEGSDQVSTALSSRVRESLASIPEIRPEVVARGRALAADPSYPSNDIVTEIARWITPFSEAETW